MQEDFHYYATYSAAFLAGYSHEESLDIAYSAQFVDLCSKTFLAGIKAPVKAATTQLQLEMMDTRMDIIGLQEITRIWSSFHFLPRDLHNKKKWRTKLYNDKYRLICGPNGNLVKKTVDLAKGGTLQAAGIAMHVLADTWAHTYFAGTPSLVINNTYDEFYEIIPAEMVREDITEKKKITKDTSIDEIRETLENDLIESDIADGLPIADNIKEKLSEESMLPESIRQKLAEEVRESKEYEIKHVGEMVERRIKFRHNPMTADDLDKSLYTNSVYQATENTIMNLGHGRAGHLPDYSFARYKYLPAWNEYHMIEKDNPSDYMNAYCQMIYALKCIRGINPEFETGVYDRDAISEHEDRIKEIITKRQLIASEDWKAFGEELSGCEIEDFDLAKYQDEYKNTKEKDATFIGQFVNAAIAHKGMVCSEIFKSGNMLAGFIQLDTDFIKRKK